MKIQDIKVKTVSKEKLEKLLAIELPENQELDIDRFAIFEDKFGIDIDCCFWNILHSHFNGKIQKVINVECRIKHFKKKDANSETYSIKMVAPDFVKTISLEDYISIADEVNLTDFIRFNYNPRIINNQKLLMRYINDVPEVS